MDAGLLPWHAVEPLLLEPAEELRGIEVGSLVEDLHGDISDQLLHRLTAGTHSIMFMPLFVPLVADLESGMAASR
jgi:hypothetical protein